MIRLRDFERAYPVRQIARHALILVWVTAIALHVVGRLWPYGALGSLEAHSYILAFVLTAECCYRWALSRKDPPALL